MPAPPDGFTEFVSVRSATLLRSAWLLTGDPGRAEDLLQAVLAVVWPRWTRVVEGGNPEAYVRQALYTTYLSRAALTGAACLMVVASVFAALRTDDGPGRTETPHLPAPPRGKQPHRPSRWPHPHRADQPRRTGPP
jgi:DNA-directed RNA polymerase specialized sigma24 family protein